MVSEIAYILGIIGGSSVAFVRSKRHPASLRRLLSLLVAAGLLDLTVLGVSGFARQGDGLSATLHASAGHLMLPLVATAVGLWFGVAVPAIWRRPFRAVFQIFFLLLLCLFCLSNTWTGYFGPSRIDPRVDPDTNLRFEVIHRWVVPVIIGIMLLFWLIRLAARSGVVEEAKRDSVLKRSC